MKKLIVLMLIVLTASALAYKLPTAWTLGGGLGTDSMRITIYRTGAANTTLTTVTDTGFVTSTAASKQGGNRTFNVDSLVAHTIRYMYFVAPDTFREYVQDVYPIEYTQFIRAYLADLDTATLAIRDSMDEAAAVPSVTIDSADKADIATLVLEGITAGSGTGVFTVTMYARDTINGAFVPGTYITAEAGASLLYATTGTNGFATFNVDAATWTFSALGSPYTWVPFSRAIAGDITDTITGGGVLVTAPSSPDEATVYGTLIGGDGEIAANWDVRFTLEDVKANLSDTATGQMVVIKVVETSTNSSGYFSKGLLKTENMLYKSGTQYKHPVWRMVASPSDVKTDPRVDFTFTIPSDSTSLDLGQLIKEGAE